MLQKHQVILTYINFSHIKKIKNLPLDSDLLDKNGNYEGEVQYSISDCIDDIIDSLEQLEE